MTEKCRKKLSVGIDKFSKIRKDNFYYIDKTGLIRELLNSWGEVNLFTRPRRFGKSLNMDMLACFFEIGADGSLFEGLKIAEETELCAGYMGQYPVISVSLKDVEAPDYPMAYDLLCGVVRDEAIRLQWLMDSDKLTQYDKEPLKRILENRCSPAELCQSIKMFSRLLYKHYGKKAIILIDEYDVPLNKAYENKYYDEMISLLRTMFSMALKTNEALYFAVLTGCLRVSKESIFTGLNNFKVYSIQDVRYDEYFGFTDEEVRKLLADYGLEEKYGEVKAWYDGYRFGRESIYCPWDVLNYVSDHLEDAGAEPVLYWANSSGNRTVRDMIEHSTGTVRAQMEQLISGEPIKRKIIPEMTYQDLGAETPEEKMTYLWSLLYNTGYLTDAEKPQGGIHTLSIPNREVRMIFEEQILTWFSKKVQGDHERLRRFCNAVKTGNAQEMEEIFSDYLRNTISIRDTAVRKDRKEVFYHGMLAGILASEDNWVILSNQESGEGYSDILVEIPQEGIGCVIEVKSVGNRNPDAACAEAVRQIKEKKYAERLLRDGYSMILAYGVACRYKECKIVCQRLH